MRVVQYEKWMRLRDGGVVNSVLNLSTALAARGHEVVLLTADDADLPREWRRGEGEAFFQKGRGTPVVAPLRLRDRVAELRGKRIEEAGWDTLTQLLDRRSMGVVREALRGAEVAHVHGVWTSSNLQVARAARAVGVPYVLSPHGNLDRFSMTVSARVKRAHLRLASGRMIRGAARVHCTSAGEAAEARAWLSNPNVDVIPLPFDTSQLRDLPGAEVARRVFPQIDRGLPVVLFLGRKHEVKRLERLIEAAGRWGGVLLVLAGPPASEAYGKSLRELAGRVGIGDRCVFLDGVVGGEAKLALYRAASVFVNLSDHENFSLVVIEAMCCGTPVVTTRATSIWPELLESGGAAIVDDDAQLDAAVAKMIKGAGEMGSAARAWALRYVDTESVMARYEKMYEAARA